MKIIKTPPGWVGGPSPEPPDDYPDSLYDSYDEWLGAKTDDDWREVLGTDAIPTPAEFEDWLDDFNIQTFIAELEDRY